MEFEIYFARTFDEWKTRPNLISKETLKLSKINRSPGGLKLAGIDLTSLDRAVTRTFNFTSNLNSKFAKFGAQGTRAEICNCKFSSCTHTHLASLLKKYFIGAGSAELPRANRQFAFFVQRNTGQYCRLI